LPGATFLVPNRISDFNNKKSDPKGQVSIDAIYQALVLIALDGCPFYENAG
jgi:hypothetical protein